MRCAPRIAKLLCVGLLMGLGGCHFFGIDTREGIEYVTVNERKTVKEPMYTRSVPGTNLVKRWPKRLGIDYGYTPWERKRNAQSVATRSTPGTAPTDPASQQAGPLAPVTPQPGAAVRAADHWQGRGNSVRQARAQLPVGDAHLPAGGPMTGVTTRPLNTAIDSNAPMRFDPLMPIDKTILPGFSPYPLPVMTDEGPAPDAGQPAGARPVMGEPVERKKTSQPAGTIKQPNPLRLRL